MMKQRTLYFDVLRILSCIMIVLMHAQNGDVGTPGWILAGSGYLEAAGIGLFFMISGALVLKSNIDDSSKDVSHFLRHRLKKIVLPLFFWYLVYSILQNADIEYTGRGVLWFLWTMGGLYLLSPILIRWLKKAGVKEVFGYLCVWGISLIYPVINLFLPVSPSNTSWIYYFHGYIGYFVLGYFLCHLVTALSVGQKVLFGIIFFLVSLCAPLVVLFAGIEVDFYAFFWYLSLPVVLQCIVWFLCIKNLEPWLQSRSEKWKSVLVWISAQTFGIYLLHILIMRGWLWKMEWIQTLQGVTHMVVCAVITFVLAMCVTAVIRKVQYLRMIVGG